MFIELLSEWGNEIVLTLLSTAVIGFAKFQNSKMRQKVNEYQQYIAEKESEKIDEAIDKKLEQVYEELEELRRYVREKVNIEQTHMSLIIASYRFRLIQICKELIKQGYMTQSQYDQLTEFYKLYLGLGGNGQAKQYYDKASQLPIRPDDDDN